MKKVLSQNILQDFSNVYELHWNDNSMLAIACRFIDEKNLQEEFKTLVKNLAEEGSEF